MPRYKLTIAYDGTDFCGWQKQFPHEDAITDAPRMEPSGSPSQREGAGGREDGAHETPGAPESRTAEAPLDQDNSSAPSALPLAPSLWEGEPARPRIELRTVQSVVERAVRVVVHQPVIIHGASRTDSGVHANGQVAAFSTVIEEDARGRGGWPVERGTHGLIRAINSRLPRDVLVLNAEVVPDDFNPIGGAVSKGYTYTIWNAGERTLWDRRTTLHVWQPLDLDKMQAAAAVLVGEHDFAAFAAAGHGRATTVRTVHACTVDRISPSQREGAGGRAAGAEDSPGNPISSVGAADPLSGSPPISPRSGELPRVPQLLRISVSGSGFLWNMVRIIAGTLVEAGKGKLTPDDIRAALATGDRRKAGPTLPPHGLCLEWIKYSRPTNALT